MSVCCNNELDYSTSIFTHTEHEHRFSRTLKQPGESAANSNGRDPKRLLNLNNFQWGNLCRVHTRGLPGAFSLQGGPSAASEKSWLFPNASNLSSCSDALNVCCLFATRIHNRHNKAIWSNHWCHPTFDQYLHAIDHISNQLLP